jgi:hypothetical protein
MLKEDLQSKCILNEISTIADILLKKAEPLPSLPQLFDNWIYN